MRGVLLARLLTAAGPGAVRVATWNVNSVRRREAIVLDWVASFDPDVLLLQETKCEEAAFPTATFLAAGRRVAVVGEKGYNGVAVAWRAGDPEPRVRRRALPGAESAGARWLEVELGDWILASLYLPNGNPVDGPRWRMKLDWMAALEAHAADLLAEERPTLLGGDWNIIPTARDCWDAGAWEGNALFRPESRRFLRRLLNAGWADPLDPETAPPRGDADPGLPPWTYWDYRRGALAADEGIRIDHLLLSPAAADRLVGAGVDRAPRREEGASDHAPAWCRFAPPPPGSIWAGAFSGPTISAPPAAEAPEKARPIAPVKTKAPPKKAAPKGKSAAKSKTAPKKAAPQAPKAAPQAPKAAPKKAPPQAGKGG